MDKTRRKRLHARGTRRIRGGGAFSNVLSAAAGNLGSLAKTGASGLGSLAKTGASGLGSLAKTGASGLGSLASSGAQTLKSVDYSGLARTGASGLGALARTGASAVRSAAKEYATRPYAEPSLSSLSKRYAPRDVDYSPPTSEFLPKKSRKTDATRRRAPPPEEEEAEAEEEAEEETKTVMLAEALKAAKDAFRPPINLMGAQTVESLVRSGFDKEDAVNHVMTGAPISDAEAAGVLSSLEGGRRRKKGRKTRKVRRTK